MGSASRSTFIRKFFTQEIGFPFSYNGHIISLFRTAILPGQENSKIFPLENLSFNTFLARLNKRKLLKRKSCHHKSILRLYNSREINEITIISKNNIRNGMLPRNNIFMKFFKHVHGRLKTSLYVELSTINQRKINLCKIFQENAIQQLTSSDWKVILCEDPYD